MFGPSPMGKRGYVYNPYHAATYAALGPIFWCSLAIWIIFTSENGYHCKFNWNAKPAISNVLHFLVTAIVSRFFSWKGFMVTTRLSYAIYLTQFPIFFFNVGRTRHADHYSFISSTVKNASIYFKSDRWNLFLLSLQSNFNEHIWVYLMSITLTLLFDNPFQNIKQLLFRKKRMPSAKTPATNAAESNLKSLDDKKIVYENEVIKQLND